MGERESKREEKGGGGMIKARSMKLRHWWLLEALWEANFIPIVEHQQRRRFGYIIYILSLDRCVT
jgi:hypothetical protein